MNKIITYTLIPLTALIMEGCNIDITYTPNQNKSKTEIAKSEKKPTTNRTRPSGIQDRFPPETPKKPNNTNNQPESGPYNNETSEQQEEPVVKRYSARRRLPVRPEIVGNYNNPNLRMSTRPNHFERAVYIDANFYDPYQPR
jgi:hypothetical protein